MIENSPKKPTDTLLSRARRDAKRATSESVTYTGALDAQAVLAGYIDWRSLTMANAAYKAARAAAPQEIPVDPQLPDNFDGTPNEDRSTAELDKWWENPFIRSRHDGTFDIRCLDGGAWDRSTWYGNAKTLDEARALAVKKLAAWKEISQQPVQSLREDGLWDIVTFGGRPDGDSMTTVLLARVKTEDVKVAMERLLTSSPA